MISQLKQLNMNKAKVVTMLPSEQAVLNEGERYLPKFRAYNAAMHLGHMASYRQALRHSYGRRVLDIGCGVGYGAFFLAGYGAKNIAALDLGALTLKYAKAHYPHPKLNYTQGNALMLPFQNGSFDFVFSSQVIEHVPDVDAFLQEIRRVLSPTGEYLIVTPNQALFSPSGTSANPHHVSEMNWAVFRQNLTAVFPKTIFYGIPQKCLQTPSGVTVPVTKPNRDIRLTDYIPQTHDLDVCENMVALGHLHHAETQAEALPPALAELAHTLLPIFWDNRVNKWMLLGYYGADENYPPLEQQLGQTLRIQFQTSLPNLYCVELDLAEELSYPLTITLIRWNADSATKEIVIQSSISPPLTTVELLFESIICTPNTQFMIEIQIKKRRLWPFGLYPSVKWATSPSEVRCWLDNNSVHLPIALRTMHQGLPQID
jgi:ubiquinone/menaquinone biosynthesis C-methylase UbiE